MRHLIWIPALILATTATAKAAPPTPSTVLSHIVSTSARQTVLESCNTPQ